MNNSVAVLGAGGIGSVLGGFLAMSGVDVTLIGRKNHVQEIKKKGLIITGVRGKYNIKIKATTDPKIMKGKRFVFLCTKSHDTEKASKLLKKYANGTIISFQNGVKNHETILRVAGKRCLIAVVNFNTLFEEAGRVKFTKDGNIVLGDPFGKRCEPLRKLLSKKFNVHIEKNILPFLWGKLLFNLINPLAALSNKGYFESLKNPYFKKSAILILDEGERILKKIGIPFKYPSINIHLMLIFLKIPNFFTLLLNFAKGEVFPSTMIDYKKKKKLEINEINGLLIEVANKHGIRAFYNERLVALTKKMAKKGKFISYNQIYKYLTF